MALSKEQITQIRDNLDSCKKPLFLFDDDQDGVCSFLQLYKYKQEGKGVIVKTTPKIGTFFLRKVEEYSPDKVFILDIADVEQDFLDEVKVPVVWIDHHGPFERHNVKYFNPRISNREDNHPVSYMCYQVAQKDLWISTVGCVADWFIPPFFEEFREKYPDLVEKYKKPGDILYNTKLGDLIRIFSFLLKGDTREVLKNIKILTRIESPYEILNQETAQGKHLYKQYQKANKAFENLRDDAMKAAEKTKERIILYKYHDDKTSFTSDLSNELIYRHPEKIIIVGREKGDELKCSIRSAKTVLPPLIDKSLIGLDGYGGGHELACGLNIKTRDFDEFLKKFSELAK